MEFLKIQDMLMDIIDINNLKKIIQQKRDIFGIIRKKDGLLFDVVLSGMNRIKRE